MFGDQQPDPRAQRNRRSGINQAFAQIEQVLEKRHAPAGVFFGGRRNGGIRLGGCGHHSLSRDQRSARRLREYQQRELDRLAHPGVIRGFQIAPVSVPTNRAPQTHSVLPSPQYLEQAAADPRTTPPPPMPRALIQATPERVNRLQWSV